MNKSIVLLTCLSLLCYYFLQISSVHLGTNCFLFPATIFPPSQKLFEETILCFKRAFKNKIDWFVPFVDQTSRTVDATAGSFKREETQSDSVIKKMYVPTFRKKGLKKDSFLLHLLERINSHVLWK